MTQKLLAYLSKFGFLTDMCHHLSFFTYHLEQSYHRNQMRASQSHKFQSFSQQGFPPPPFL